MAERNIRPTPDTEIAFNYWKNGTRTLNPVEAVQKIKVYFTGPSEMVVKKVTLWKPIIPLTKSLKNLDHHVILSRPVNKPLYVIDDPNEENWIF